MANEDKIFLFDVNHTLINTAAYHTKALTEVEKHLKKYIDAEAARYITNRFNEIFLLMVAGFLFRTDEEWKEIPGGRESYEELVELITKHQIKVKEKWGFIKKWSREVFLKIAADEIQVHIPSDVIFNTATVYWNSITKFTKPFSEAKKLHTYLSKKGYKIYLLTSSDGRLQVTKGFFTFDAKFSEIYKKGRIETLKKKGLYFREIIVGDPYDKPLPEYYKHAKEVIQGDLGHEINPQDLVMVGNSFEDDLETPILLFDFGQGFLFKKDSSVKKIHNKIHRVGSLLDIISIMKI